MAPEPSACRAGNPAATPARGAAAAAAAAGAAAALGATATAAEAPRDAGYEVALGASARPAAPPCCCCCCWCEDGSGDWDCPSESQRSTLPSRAALAADAGGRWNPARSVRCSSTIRDMDAAPAGLLELPPLCCDETSSELCAAARSISSSVMTGIASSESESETTMIGGAAADAAARG